MTSTDDGFAELYLLRLLVIKCIQRIIWYCYHIIYMISFLIREFNNKDTIGI